MPYFAYDLAAAAILLLFALWGSRKGLVLTLCSLLAVFVALIGAAFLSDALAEPVAKAVEPMVAARIQESLTEAIQSTEFVSADGGVAQSPEEVALAGVIQHLKETELFQGFADAFQNAVDNGVAEVTANAAQSLAHFVAVQIARMVLFAVAFFAILIAWFFLSHALDLVAKLPVLNTLNRWGGAAAGLVKGALVLFILCWLLRDSCIPREAVEHSILLKLFCTAAPLSFFL